MDISISKVFEWLEPVLEKNGALAGIEEIAPSGNGKYMLFTFRPVLKKVNRNTLLDVYYRVVIESVVEAFEIPEKHVLFSRARRLGKRIRVQVPMEVLEQALVTGTAWELRLVPGDLVSLTSVCRTGSYVPGMPRADLNWVSWRRTIGIVVRGPAHKNDEATLVVLSVTDSYDWDEVASARGAWYGFSNYRRLCAAADFKDRLQFMARTLTRCNDRVQAKLAANGL